MREGEKREGRWEGTRGREGGRGQEGGKEVRERLKQNEGQKWGSAKCQSCTTVSKVLKRYSR